MDNKKLSLLAQAWRHVAFELDKHQTMNFSGERQMRIEINAQHADELEAVLAEMPAMIPVGMIDNGEVVEIPNPFRLAALAQQAQPQKEAGPHPSYDVPTLPEHHSIVAQQAQPEMPTREMIANEIEWAIGQSPCRTNACVAADRVLALFVPKETAEPRVCMGCGVPWVDGHECDF